MPPYTLNVPAKVETHEDAPYLVDIVAIRPDKRLGPGDRYTGTFLASSPSENALRAADQVYPDWVTERYLTLSDSVPGRIKRLAADITGGATNPYDQARAIEDYLRTFEYGSSPSQPGSNQDRVDHFLFDTQTGHSDHFASAMAVMLRAEGIPSRLVSGFGPGDYDLEAQEFVISGRDLHSWPEAFFPGLGWVEFEPSPIYPLRPRAQEDLLAFGLGGTRLSLDGLPADGADGTLPSEEDNFVEVDPGGGRLPGGEGARPLPLFRIPTPMSTGGALLGVTTATWLLVLWLVWRRFFATLPGPEHAFSRLQRMARLLQVRPRPGQTPLEFGSTLAAAVPQAGADIALICQTYGGALYGEAELQDSDRGMLTAAWHRVRKAIVRQSLGQPRQ
jgi:transglutaminase-like putative cysteine protease